VLHFLWLVKKDVREPAIFGLVLVALLALRLGRGLRRARAAGAAPRPDAAREALGART
jgi:sulfoxide reductase heme-binding subunit YedZ